LFLALGHACEWPADAAQALVAHTTEHPGHQRHDRAVDSGISCGAPDVLPNTVWLPAGPGLDVAGVLLLETPVPARWIAPSREESIRPAGRPPLFLLHASLLI
jgi:hypothetical protein